MFTIEIKAVIMRVFLNVYHGVFSTRTHHPSAASPRGFDSRKRSTGRVSDFLLLFYFVASNLSPMDPARPPANAE